MITKFKDLFCGGYSTTFYGQQKVSLAEAKHGFLIEVFRDNISVLLKVQKSKLLCFFENPGFEGEILPNE